MEILDLLKLHNEELHNLYPTPRITRMIMTNRMGRRACGTNENWNACRFLVENPEGKTPLGRPRYIWMGWYRLNSSDSK
jgi:hypothetical protein